MVIVFDSEHDMKGFEMSEAIEKALKGYVKANAREHRLRAKVFDGVREIFETTRTHHVLQAAYNAAKNSSPKGKRDLAEALVDAAARSDYVMPKEGDFTPAVEKRRREIAAAKVKAVTA
ncbi:hypothetical protein [Bosea sp. RAC05]|uniref:hypothetical protein n=1 Tax=Bosea sp. RAC05 TaxID=1842539 RepID=UPI00083E6435|nr:hypothetical protein [Bosea sp. RAC05]AOG05851.1 hypothetical protein BSY19_1178 [Bosea sp. RAC05]